MILGPGASQGFSDLDVSELFQLVRREYQVYGSDWSLPGFRAMAVYRFGRWALELNRDSIRRRVVGRILDRIHITLHRYVRNRYGIELSKGASIGPDVLVLHQGGITVGYHSTIGARCIIHQNVTIGNAGRGVSADKAPSIGDDVELGVGAAVLGDVEVGDGARIGANVVVYTKVPARATVVAHAPRFIYAPQARRPRQTDADD